jgi:Methyltransferase domain
MSANILRGRFNGGQLSGRGIAITIGTREGASMTGDIKENPMLDELSIANCRIYTDRVAMAGALVPSGGIGAEVGIWDGDFSAILLQILAPARLHLIDISIRERVTARFGNSLHGPILCLHEGDSAEALRQFPDEHFDWIYIDGDHSYPGVRRDAEVAVRKIKPTGLLLFNDYTMGDHNVSGGFYPYGVIRVVNELCLHSGFEMIGFAFHPEMYGDVAIRRRITKT